MYLCRSCGKFSKSTALSESQQTVCKKCRAPSDGPLGTLSVPLARSGDTGDLPPGFGTLIQFTPTEGVVGIRGRMVLKFTSPLSIPGTTFCYILPMQDKVKRSTVQEKMEKILSGELKPEVEVIKTDKEEVLGDVNPGAGRLVLDDNGHHTFVAALEVGAAITLNLRTSSYSHQFKDWTQCKYVDHF